MKLTNSEQPVAVLTRIRSAAEQKEFVSSLPTGPTQALAEAISRKIRELLPRDPDLAQTFSETNLYIASVLDTPLAWAYANRSRAQVLYTMRRSADAADYYAKSALLFEQTGLKSELGRTLVGQVDNLMYLGRYADALETAQRARAALEQANDASYLPVLDIALGNLYYRLNKYRESLAHYDRAEKALQNSDNAVALASIGLNRAYVLTEINRFDEAVQSFELTKERCERHGLDLWAAFADRGISQMQFRRGNYSTSLRILDAVRRKHEASGDLRRVGLCDLDRAEIYLELNLFEDAAVIASRACEIFNKLGNRYEAAKCLVYQGIAQFKLRNDCAAEQALTSARRMFIDEGNDLWMAIIDLWRAQLLLRREAPAAALQLAQHAAEVFESRRSPSRAANARVLCAQALLASGSTDLAAEEAQKAVGHVESCYAPSVAYQCYNTLGRVNELQRAFTEAEQLYRQAIAGMESLRGNIGLDEMRMSFGRDKYQVYENMVRLKLRCGEAEEAFLFVEKSKSRTLIDLLERNLETVCGAGEENSPRLQRIRRLREEMNILYSRLDALGGSVRDPAIQKTTKEEITRREQELLELLREAGSERSGWVRLHNLAASGVQDVQEMLSPGETFIEYYTVDDKVQAFVISKNNFHIARDITTAAALRRTLNGVRFQLSKFQLDPAYLQLHQRQLLETIRRHLHTLYCSLIEPIRPHIAAQRLIIAPHQLLHYIPFSALYDGETYLIDSYDVSQAPSASVLKLCREKQIEAKERDLVLAAPDEMTPYIHEEVEALRGLLPNALFFTGADATQETLGRYGRTASRIHVAAHGIFRADNPMFSSLKLGGQWLNLFDIFNLQLEADLTVLSACETGMNAIWEGDELLGLARGFLYAGCPSLLVSLWMVNDRSTAMLMRRFYEALQQGLSKACALREAMIAVKAEFPHPYYWAPFVLMGRS